MTDQGGSEGAPDGAVGPPPDPMTLLRSRGYVAVLVFAAVLGAPIALLSYWFLQLVAHLQGWLYTDLAPAIGFDHQPVWWPIPMLIIGGFLVALTIRYLPGRGGASPADGFHAHKAQPAIVLPGIAAAALLTLGFGAVLGPEAPLIALGSGMAAWAVHLARRNAPQQAVALIGTAGSFAAISTLLGSPLLAAFLLMEVAGLGGAMISLVLIPGLLAAGIGALVFIGLDSLTGLGTTSLEIPSLPPAGTPTIAEFSWALAIGVAAAIIGTAIRWLGLTVRPTVERRLLVGVPAAGLVVALLAVLYTVVTNKNASDVLFSGQTGLPQLIASSAQYSVGTLILLMVCKGIGYGVSLAGFRGGPIFPSMYLGAAMGMAASHLPGLGLIPGIAMGIGAMCVTMLGFPLVSVLLATLLLASDGLQVMPLVIVAVVVAYVVRAWLLPLLPGADRAKTERAPQPGSSQPSPTLAARITRRG